MPKFTPLALIVAFLFASTPIFAAEELSTDTLIVQEIPRSGDFMAFGFDSLWMMQTGKLLRVNPADNSVLEINVAGSTGSNRGVAIGERAVWIPDTGSGTIYKVDPISNSVVNEISASFYDSEGSIGVGEGSVWIVTIDQFQEFMTRLNSKSGAVEATIPLEKGSISAVADYGSVWVTNYRENELYRIDPQTNKIVGVTALHERTRFLASGEGAIWVLNQSDCTVQRIDAKTGAVVATIETVNGSRGGGDIVVGGGFVWVTLKGMYPVVQIDPHTNTLKRIYKGFRMGDAIRYGADSLWVYGNSIFRIQPPD
jgi:virginiamycin B lyase